MHSGKLVGTGETQAQHRGTTHGLSSKSSGRVRVSTGPDAGRLAAGNGTSAKQGLRSAPAADGENEFSAWDGSASSHAFDDVAEAEAVAVDLNAMD